MFKNPEVEALKTVYTGEIFGIDHESWVYVFDANLVS